VLSAHIAPQILVIAILAALVARTRVSKTSGGWNPVLDPAKLASERGWIGLIFNTPLLATPLHASAFSTVAASSAIADITAPDCIPIG
jgi:hypothetical protein